MDEPGSAASVTIPEVRVRTTLLGRPGDATGHAPTVDPEPTHPLPSAPTPPGK
ncbi:hypothetical protein [Marichromatium gracile]|uniref:hypothetical protein n=1 Tax=Marichromatium gracile TaxID=1048 RepID=UPI0013667750|nr:hypothetical protein [Marichromatium gracile]